MDTEMFPGIVTHCCAVMLTIIKWPRMNHLMKTISYTHPHALRKRTVDQEEGTYNGIYKSVSVLLTPVANT